MATRTIANGGGNWNSTSAWVEGVVPTSADDVIATGTSGPLTINVSSACRSINLTNYVSTLTHSASVTLSIGDASGGSLTFPTAGWTYTPASNTTSILNFVSTSDNAGAGWSVDFGGKNMPKVIFSGVGGRWTLARTVTVNGPLDLQAGYLDLNGFNVSVPTQLFTMSGTGIKTLALGLSSITANFFQYTGSNLTVPANSSTVTFGTLGLGNLNWNGASFVSNGTSNTYTIAVNGSATVKSLSVSVIAVSGAAVNISGSLTVTNDLTITGTSTYRVSFGVGATPSTPITVTVNGTITASHVDFTGVNAAGSASWNLSGITGGCGDCGLNTGITFTPAVTRYCVGTTLNSTSAWSTTSGGASGASAPLPQDSVHFDANSPTAPTAYRMKFCKDLDMTGYTGTWTPSISFHVHGSITLPVSAGSSPFAGTSTIIMRSTGPVAITSNGSSFGTVPIQITSVDFGGLSSGATVTLQDDFTQSNANNTTNLIVLTPLNTNDKTVTVSKMWTSSAYGQINFGSSTVNVLSTEATSVLDFSAGSVSAANATFNFASSASISRTFVGGGRRYGALNYTVAGSTGALVITGNNSFGALNIGPGRTLKLPAAGTTTMDNLSGSGVLGNTSTLNSSTPGSASNISVSEYQFLDYFSVQDINVIGTGVVAARNSTNVSGNSGIIFGNQIEAVGFLPR